MLNAYWRLALGGLALLGTAFGVQLWLHAHNAPTLEWLQLADGSPVIRVHPGTPTRTHVLIGVPAEQALSDAQLLALSAVGHAELLQFSLAEGDCTAQQQRFQASLQRLDNPPTLVAGIGTGASLAWRWLAEQPNDQAQALSVGFNVEDQGCPQPLPAQAAHGHWRVVWNDNPNDASARFVRQQANAEPLISDYGAPLNHVLDAQLRRYLQGETEDLPVVEVRANQPAETVTFFYSGDGGWRDLDRAVAGEMAKRGYSVVGIDALRYYWRHKTPEQSAEDLATLMRQYRQKWGAKRFVLSGYSFGANILPATYNRLSTGEQQQIDAILLIALARSASFEIQVQGWLGRPGQEASIAPEMTRLPASKVLCIYGHDEIWESGCTTPRAVGERLELSGGHHFDGDYPKLADRLIQAIKRRQPTVID